ncbi:MAG: aminotransferase class I/II-fold pyridoxal phosphate-dependent enzyme [Coriobacteriia bacterium]|nr:aminotransferase class I/II-fold pyridoxal phosphate-dependent enzyme [Coriobacteriia bacterium]
METLPRAAMRRDGIDERIAAFAARRAAAEAADRYFYLQATTGKTNHRVRMADGREMVQLASYSYLGLIGHPRIEEAAAEALAEYGTGAGGVRLLTGTTDLHEALEERIARFTGREDACVYSSGYVTNIAIITGLTGPGDLVLMDKLDHASIVDGCLLSGARWKTYRHNDMGHLEKLLAEAEGAYRTVLVAADSVFSMDGDVMDLPRAVELCREHGARLMVDEAHSVGSLGATGHGIEEHFGMPGVVDLKMGTLSKSIPSVGGYLAGTGELVDYQRHMSRPFIFSAALPPAQTAAALAAFDVIEEEPWRVARLHEVQRAYAEGLRAQGWDTMRATTCVVPVLVGDEGKAMDLTRHMFDRRVFVCPIVHPAVPRGTDRLRTCLMATHTDDDIAQALAAFAEAREMGFVAA